MGRKGKIGGLEGASVMFVLVVIAMVVLVNLGIIPMSTTGGGLIPSTTPPTPVGVDDNIGQYRPALYNNLNVSGTEYLSATMRIYELAGGKEEFKGTVTTQTGGIQARDASSGVAKLQVFNTDGSAKQYVAYVPSSDASVTSKRVTFTMKEDVATEIPVPQQAALNFKVYDEENRGYVYKSAETTAGGLQVTGQSFYSTTSNSSGYAVGQGSFYDYTIYFSTNGTAAVDTQFEDQAVLIAVDGQDLSDWQEPSLSLAGASITKLSSGEYNSKIANDGYDWVYKVEQNGKPLHVVNSFHKLGIQQYPKAGTDPSDNIKVALYTSGYYKQTTGDQMKMDTHKDDSSQTAVYTAQDVTLVMA